MTECRYGNSAWFPLSCNTVDHIHADAQVALAWMIKKKTGNCSDGKKTQQNLEQPPLKSMHSHIHRYEVVI